MDNKVSLDRLISYVLEISKEHDNYIESEEKEDSDSLNKEDLCPGEMSNLEILPDKLKELIGPYTENYYRVGVVKEKKEKREMYNVSLYYSIIFCIDKQFSDFTENEKYVYLERMVGMMKLNLDQIYKKNEYRKLGWTKKKLLQEFNSYTNSNIVIKFLSDYLNINVIIFDWNTDHISMCYTEEYFNRYKPSIVLLRKEGFFEPIISSTSKLLWNNDPLFEFILTNNKDMLQTLNTFAKTKPTEKSFEIKLENLDQYLDQPEKAEDEKAEDGDEDEDDENEDDEENEDKNENVDNNKQNNQPDNPIVRNNNNEVQNEFDDVDLESSELSDDSIDTQEETELEPVDQTIFLKQKKKDTEKNTNNDKVNISTVPVNDKMKLEYLQQIAKTLKISVTGGKYKNGTSKQKTKGELCSEINRIQN